MSSAIAASAKISPKREPVFALFILLLFICINLISATRVPTVFMDEVEYTDPAASLYLGDGFTSTMWQQGRNEFWCGNVPLYPALLYCFFKFFGFGLLQARMLSALLAAAGGLLIWGGLRRSNFVPSPSGRLLSLCLVLSGSVSTMTFRLARYDATMFFVCALVFFFCTLPTIWGARYLAVLLASALLPAIGIAMLPYAGLMCLMYAAVYGRRLIGLPVAVVAGLASGAVGLYLFYQRLGVWPQFVEIVLPFTSFGSHDQTHARSLKSVIVGDSLGDENLLTSFFGNPTRFLDPKTLFDYSAFILFVIVILLSLKIWRVTETRERKLIFFILLATLVTPAVMHLAGHYRSYYRWMTYVPLAIVTPHLMEVAAGKGCGRWIRRVALPLIGCSLMLGVPLRTLSAVPDWRARSIQPLEQAVSQMAQSDDIVVCSYKAYYALRPRVKVVYGFGLPARGVFEVIKDFPADKISLLCVLPEDTAKVTHAVGGRWKRIPLAAGEASSLARTRYPVEFYRRDQ